LFRQNLANRIWAQFFGRGIVEPVDDVRISNPPSNSQLLEDLGQHLADYDFDLRRLIRDICTSHTYQASTIPNATSRSDRTQFSHQSIRRMRADVLLDAISETLEIPTEFAMAPLGQRAGELYSGNFMNNNYFLNTFGLCPRTTVNVSDTRFEPTLAQTLHLIDGDTIQNKLDRSPVVSRMIAAHAQPAEIIDELFIRTYSRKPSDKERQRIMGLIGEHPDRAAYDDFLWSLLNSTEFEFNH
jgi:hypothetical protein